MKTALYALWLMATGAGIMALWILTIEKVAGKLSLALIWLSLFTIGAGLTLYTVKSRKAAKGKLKVVGR